MRRRSALASCSGVTILASFAGEGRFGVISFSVHSGVGAIRDRGLGDRRALLATPVVLREADGAGVSSPGPTYAASRISNSTPILRSWLR